MSYTDKLTALSNSIKAKNPNYTGNLSLAKMKEAVDGISGGTDVSVVTATAGDVLNTKKIVLPNKSLVSGSMANNGAVSKTLSAQTTSYTIPAGYHNGSGKVSVSAQTKSVTPSTTSSQTITPDSGKILTGITLAALVAGKTQYSGSTTINPTSSMYSITINTGVSIDSSSIIFIRTAGARSYSTGYSSEEPWIDVDDFLIYNGSLYFACTPRGQNQYTKSSSIKEEANVNSPYAWNRSLQSIKYILFAGSGAPLSSNNNRFSVAPFRYTISGTSITITGCVEEAEIYWYDHDPDTGELLDWTENAMITIRPSCCSKITGYSSTGIIEWIIAK